jgi:hypothetical protein
MSCCAAVVFASQNSQRLRPSEQMNKNGARTAKTHARHTCTRSSVLLWLKRKKRDAAAAADQWPTYGVGGEQTPSPPPTPRRNLQFLVLREGERETERFMPRVYITSISRMILYINSTSANICPALMNCMDFLIRSASLSLALFLEERQRHRLKLIRQTSQCVSVIYFVYLFIEIDVCNIYALGCRIKLDTLLSAISFLMPEWCKN